MPWLDLLILIGAIYLVIVLGRGLIDFVNWLLDVFIREPRERQRLARRARKKRLQSQRQGADDSPDVL